MSQANFDQVLAFVNQALPVAPPFDRSYFVGPGYVDQAIAAGKSEQEYADALTKAVQALNVPVDASGQYQSARREAFTGEFNVQDLIVGWLNGGSFPSDQAFRDRIFGGAADPNATPPVPPSQPPVGGGGPPVGGPPNQLPPGQQNSAADLQALRDQVAKLQLRVDALWKLSGGTEGGPGIG